MSQLWTRIMGCNPLNTVSECLPGSTGSSGGDGKSSGQKKSGASKARNERQKKDRLSLISNILGRETGDVRDQYTLGKEIGKGQFGVTHQATDIKTGEHVACKIIAKRKLLLKEDVDDLRREVAIMHHLTGHPCFLQLKGAYEDAQHVYLITELCGGGELFDRIVSKGKYSERQAATVCREIIKMVEMCHSLGVMHRDLKPESLLYATKKDDALLKASEFGVSIFFKPGETFTNIVGSAYYVAPEVLRRRYGPEADIWSCGVILYILLCGVPPFWADDEQGIFDAILRGAIDLKSPPWPSISEQAKDLIKKMLNTNPKERLTASQVLRHPWIKVGGSAPDKPLDGAVITRLKNFSAMNKMKKLALRVIATCLSEEEIKGLKEMFKTMDVDCSGTITYTELKAGLAMYGANMPEEQVKVLMEGSDMDGSGSINYQEFITATLNMNKSQKEENLFQAFQHFDTDGSGFITMNELRKALADDGDLEPGEIEAIIKEVDSDKDGKINYEEFADMMRKDTDEPQGRGNDSAANGHKSSMYN